jgi:hypothetical protein
MGKGFILSYLVYRAIYSPPFPDPYAPNSVVLHVFRRPPHPLWFPENVTRVICRRLCTDVNTKVSDPIASAPNILTPFVLLQLRNIQADRSAGFADHLRLYSEGGIPPSLLSPYLYCTSSPFSVDCAGFHASSVMGRMRIRGTSRLRIRCHSRLWIFEMSSAPDPSQVDRPKPTISTTVLSLSNAIPKGQGMCWTQRNSPFKELDHDRERPPPPHRLKSIFLPAPFLVSFVWHPGLSPFLSHPYLMYLFPRSPFVFVRRSFRSLLSVLGWLGISSLTISSVHNVLTITIHIRTYSCSCNK